MEHEYVHRLYTNTTGINIPFRFVSLKLWTDNASLPLLFLLAFHWIDFLLYFAYEFPHSFCISFSQCTICQVFFFFLSTFYLSSSINKIFDADKKKKKQTMHSKQLHLWPFNIGHFLETESNINVRFLGVVSRWIRK